MVGIVRYQKLQLAEIEYFLPRDDGKIQPGYSNDISMFDYTFEEIRKKITSYGNKSYFELLDIEDLL